jgi:hypothetical protein
MDEHARLEKALAAAAAPLGPLMEKVGLAVTDEQGKAIAIALTGSEGGLSKLSDLVWLHPDRFANIVKKITVDEEKIHVAIVAKLELLYDLGRAACGLATKMHATAAQGADTAAAAAAVPSGKRTVKLATFVDQTMEAEAELMETAAYGEILQSYVAIYGAEPKTAPSIEQFSAFNALIQAGNAPYVDFAIWGPDMRKRIKRARVQALVWTADGDLKRREVPGVQSFAQWRKSWRVFETALQMLWHAGRAGGASQASLAKYERCIEELVETYPEAWYIVMEADDKMRAEHWPALGRKMQADGASRPTDRGFWDCVIERSADEIQFWRREVEHQVDRVRQTQLQARLRPDPRGRVPPLKPVEDDRGGKGEPGTWWDGPRTPKGPRKGKGGTDFRRRQGFSEGRQICIAHQEDQCHDASKCGRLHICTKCKQAHPAPRGLDRCPAALVDSGARAPRK